MVLKYVFFFPAQSIQRIKVASLALPGIALFIST